MSQLVDSTDTTRTMSRTWTFVFPQRRWCGIAYYDPDTPKEDDYDTANLFVCMQSIDRSPIQWSEGLAEVQASMFPFDADQLFVDDIRCETYRGTSKSSKCGASMLQILHRIQKEYSIPDMTLWAKDAPRLVQFYQSLGFDLIEDPRSMTESQKKQSSSASKWPGKGDTVFDNPERETVAMYLKDTSILCSQDDTPIVKLVDTHSHITGGNGDDDFDIDEVMEELYNTYVPQAVENAMHGLKRSRDSPLPWTSDSIKKMRTQSQSLLFGNPAYQGGFPLSPDISMLWNLIGRWSTSEKGDGDRELLARIKKQYEQLDGLGQFLVETAGKLEFYDRIKRNTDMVVLKQHWNHCGSKRVVFAPMYLNNMLNPPEWSSDPEQNPQYWAFQQPRPKNNFLIFVPNVTDSKLIPGATASCRHIQEGDRNYAALQMLSSFHQQGTGRTGSKAIEGLCTVARQLGLQFFYLFAAEEARGFYAKKHMLNMELCVMLYDKHLETDFANTATHTRADIQQQIYKYCTDEENWEWQPRLQDDTYEPFLDRFQQYCPGLRDTWNVHPFEPFSAYNLFIDAINETVLPRLQVSAALTDQTIDQQTSLFLVNGNALCVYNGLVMLNIPRSSIGWAYYEDKYATRQFYKYSVAVGLALADNTPFVLSLNDTAQISYFVADNQGDTQSKVRDVLDSMISWLGSYAPQVRTLTTAVKSKYLIAYGFKQTSDAQLQLQLPTPAMPMQ